MIQDNWQGNRNPFVDHPEWVLDVWEYNQAIATRTQGGGRIAPENPAVRYRADQWFDIQPDRHWRIADVRTNGESLGVDFGASAYSFVWREVRGTGTVEAVFAPDLAPAGTPLWWLEAHGVTNDYAAAELDDPDGDGVPTWREWLANTDPTSAGSRFQLEAAATSPEQHRMVLRWQSASNRVYSIWRTPSPSEGFVHSVAADLPATPPVNVYTDALDGAASRFYAIEVLPAE